MRVRHPASQQSALVKALQCEGWGCEPSSCPTMLWACHREWTRGIADQRPALMGTECIEGPAISRSILMLNWADLYLGRVEKKNRTVQCKVL
jgi:hypothetical protein